MTISSIGDACTGCGACRNICPYDAIVMRETTEGFLAPIVSTEKCIECGLCYKICPHNYDVSNDSSHIEGYLATTFNCQFYQNSATIGLCTLLSKFFIENGGVVFGAELDEKDWTVRHVKIEKVEDLDRIRNSKYVQSDVSDSFREIESLLLAEGQVLFIGTPCQVAGLKSYLRKRYDTLLTIDLICHGVYSHKLLSKEVDYWQTKYNGIISNFRFRSKKIYPWIKGGIINFDVKKGCDTKHIEIPGPYSPTYRCYAYSGDGLSYNLRTSCYRCDFRSKSRYGDLTVGDAWFMQDYKPELFNEENLLKGISLLFVNTDNGRKWLGLIKPHVKLYDVSQENMFMQPALLPSDREIPPQRKTLYDNIDQENYSHLINRILGVDIDALYKEFMNNGKGNIIKRIKRRIRSIINSFL